MSKAKSILVILAGILSSEISITDALKNKIRLFYYKNRLGYLGKNSKIQKNCILSNPQNIFIGDNVFIGSGVKIYAYEKVEIGNNVLIASDCIILTRNHLVKANSLIREQGYSDKPITIGADCWLGFRSIILPNCNLSNGTVVGAGTVITKSTQKNEIIIGTSGKFLRKRN